MFSKKLSAFVALSLVTASGAAPAQSAQSLSLANAPGMARAGAPVQDASNLENRGNGYGVYLVGALVIAAIVYGILQLTDNDDEPESP
jgi:hypothetical protein